MDITSHIFSQALDLIRGKNYAMLMDSCLDAHLLNDDRTDLVRLASRCLEYESRDRPNTKTLISSLVPLQKETEVGYSFNAHIHGLIFAESF